MTQETTLVPSKLIQRQTEDFKALPQRGRPGGSSSDSQFFTESETQALWIGKCSSQAMSKPHARFPGVNCYYEEYKEWLGLAIYQLLGIITPTTQLSVQSVVKPSEGAVDDFDYEHPCVHVMSKFVEGFTPFGETFLERYHQMATQSESHTISVIGKEGTHIPLQGFGATLAVACFIYDLDCLGRSGGNMGYVVGQDKDGKPCAQTVKIDPGFAFSFLENFDDVSYKHDPRQRDIRYAPGRVAKNQTCILRYDQLHPSDQREFARTARQILQIPGSTFKALIDPVVSKDGFTAQQADRLLNELLARKSIFMAAYAPEVSHTLQAEVQDALREVMAVLAKPSTQVSKVHPTIALEVKHNQPEKTPLLSDLKDLKYEYKYSPVTTEPTEDKKKGSASASSSPLLPQSIAPDEDTEVKLNTFSSPVDEKKSGHISPDTASMLDQYETKTRTIYIDQLQLTVDQWKHGTVDSKTTRCAAFQVPPKNPYFTGRVTLLTQVAQQLHSQRGSLITQSISGLGGVGKTQLAGYYAQLAVEGATCGGRRLTYKAVLWLHAEQDLGVQFQAMAELWCNRTDLSAQEAVQVVYGWLRDKPALIVFDNATHADALTAFLPPAQQKGLLGFLTRRSSTHHILITSRNPDWADIPTLSLSGFTQEEARPYVRQRLPKASNAEIDALVASVSNLPLALSHAVAYIVEGHCTLADYPSQFVLHQLSLGGRIAHTERATHTVLSTFLLTMARLQREHPCVSLILQTAAYLAPEGIPVSLLDTELAKRQSTYSAQQLQQGIAVLTRHALLQPGKDGRLDMHRLVQQVIRNQLSPTEQHLRLTAVLQLVGQAYPEEGRGHAADAARKMFIPHLKALIEQQDSSGRPEDTHLALVLDLLGHVYGHLGDVAKQRDLLLRALNIDETHYGLDHWQLAPTLTNLGNAYGALGDVAQQRDLLLRALNIDEAHYGPDHWQLASTLTNLGNAYGALGDVAKKRDLLLRALNIQEAHYSPDHWQLAPTLTNLGNAYGALGDVAQKRDLLLRALKIDEAHYGSDHWQLAPTLTNLGDVYRVLGDATQARDLLLRALKIQEAHYGSDHWQVASTLVNLGNAYGALGDVGQQRDLLLRALKIEEAHYGPDHWQLGQTLMNLGIAYGALGDVAKKRDFLLRALNMKETHYGSDHPEVAITLANLAVAYSTLKEPKAALLAAQRVYRIMVFHPHYGQQNPVTQRYLKVLQSEGFTLAQLRTPLEQKEKKDQKHSTSQTPFISSILPASHFAPPRRSSTSDKIDPEQALGQTVVGLVDTIARQLNKTSHTWDPQAPATFASNIVSACAKGKEVLEAQLKDPELYSLPKQLVPCIRDYISKHPILYELHSHSDLAQSFEKSIVHEPITRLTPTVWHAAPRQKRRTLRHHTGIQHLSSNVNIGVN